MPEEITTGVTDSGAESGAASGASLAASPAAEAQPIDTTGATVEQTATPEGAGTAPAVTEAEPDEGIQPESFSDEKARNAFIHLRQQKQDARELRTVVDPLFTEAATVYGIEWQGASPDERRAVVEAVQSDHKMVGSLYGETPEARGQFFAKLYEQSPETYFRVESDLAQSPRMQALLFKELGFDLSDDAAGPTDEMQQAIDWLKSGSWKTQPRTEQAAQFNEATLTDIADPALQAVYKSLDKAGRDYADALYGEDLTGFLRREQQAQSWQRSETERHEREQQTQREQFANAVNERKEQAYQSVRNIVKDSLAKLFPNDDKALNFVMAAAESQLYGSEEGAALWHELEGFIERGETRQLQGKLPQMIAKARAIATETAKYLNERESKARQFDDLMRIGSPDEIMRFIAQARGGQTVLPTGSRPTGNGNANVPDPSQVGRYDPANIISYFPRG